MSNGVEDAKVRGGIVFYPRQYHVTSDMDESYAIGVTHDNEECVVYIRPSDDARERARVSTTAQTIPTLLEFSEEGRRARNPCFASPDNSPDSPVGTFLLEQASLSPDLSAKHGGLPVYVGLWASVLRESDDMPEALIGPGYMEIGFSPRVDPQVNEYMVQYRELMSAIEGGHVESLIDAEEQRSGLYRAIMAGRKKWFVGVMLKPEQSVRLASPTARDLARSVIPAMERYTRDGMYGGAIVRTRLGGVVIPDLCASCNMEFDYKNEKPRESREVFETFMKFHGKKILWNARNNNYSIDVIPTQRVNCGSRGIDKFSKQFEQSQTPKILKTYVDKEFHNDPFANYTRDGAYLYASMAIRLAVIGKGRRGEGNVLISSSHAYSSPMGSIYSIDAAGLPNFQVDRKNRSGS